MTASRWCSLCLVLAACSSRSSSPPREVAATAPPAATAPDAATPPAAAPAWQPTSLPRTVAVTSAEGVTTLARVSTTEVAVLGTVPSPGTTRAWLDDRTLVALSKRDGGGFVVATVVDGRRGDDLVVTPAEWPAFAAELVVGDGEVWLSGCTKDVEFTDCTHDTAIRLRPAPRVVQAQVPTGRRRYGYHGDHRAEAPAGAAPAGITARLDEVRDGDRVEPSRTKVTCTSAAGTTQVSLAALFDMPLELEVFQFAAPRLRWLATTPPLIEVSYRYTDPVEITRDAVHVLRSCEEPLADFRWLGEGVWAELDQRAYPPAVWRVRRGDQVLGELPAGALD